MNGADAIVKCLEKEGVEVVYGYPGVAICPFFDSLLKTDIRPVLVREEQNAAHSASGYARMTGKVGVCAVTSGPGATNLITGIATAFADSIPLVCITGQVASSMIGSDVFQEADITGAVESFVKYSYLVRDVKDIPRILKEAFYIASSGRRGPVLIDVPCDLQEASLDRFSYPDAVQMRTYKPTVEGNPVQIKKVVKVLEKSERPLICVGGGVSLSGAVDEIRDFCEKLQIPVVSTMMGISVMPSKHPLYIGMVGNNGRPCANRAMKEADLLLVIGARVADRAVNRPDIITDGKALVHIDVDPAEIGKNVGPTIPLVGDIRHVFAKLSQQEIEMKAHEAWIDTLHTYQQEMQEKRARIGKEYADPKTFLENLSEEMAKDAVYVADVGQNQIWATAFWNVGEKNRFLTSGGMGTMGYSIPAALGAKMAKPNRQVLVGIGDGAFQMAMPELGTMIQEKIDLKIIVYRNNTLGMVHEYQHHVLHNRYTVVNMCPSPDLEKLAEAYGMPYWKIDGTSDQRAVLKDFLKKKESAILEVMVDPDDLVKAGY